jgi:hypothetical protein
MVDIVRRGEALPVGGGRRPGRGPARPLEPGLAAGEQKQDDSDGRPDHGGSPLLENVTDPRPNRAARIG